MHLRGPKGQLKVSPQSGARAGSLPSCAAEQPGKVCLASSAIMNNKCFVVLAYWLYLIFLLV